MAAGQTFELTSYNVLSSNTTSWTISGISQAYDDLKIYCAFVCTQGAGILVQVNGGAANYYYSTSERAQNTGSGQQTQGQSNAQSAMNIGLMGNISYNPVIIDLPGYRMGSAYNRGMMGSSAYTENGNGDFGGGYVRMGIFATPTSSNITSITFSHPSANMIAGSIVSIYGITGA